ncbi:MAG: 7-carboxy-7-deazaguanine synthase QueE [Pirellulaceae bacterium]
MFICELYKSIQGEGLLTGTESVFVRSSGCNLRCDFCDTPWSSWEPEGEHVAIEDIVRRCVDLQPEKDRRYVVLTGGEPMLQPDVGPLTEQFADAGFHITIETAGTIDKPVECQLMSISPKLANSTPPVARAERWTDKHEQTRHCPQVIEALTSRYAYQLKFVVDQPGDCRELVDYLQQFPQIHSDQVLLMPQGVEQAELQAKEPWIREFCEEHGFVFCPRMHITWFGNKRGT